jgi:hypothetical protein
MRETIIVTGYALFMLAVLIILYGVTLLRG